MNKPLLVLIAAGGRDYSLTESDYAILDGIHERYGIAELVHGDCYGVDRDCGEWAQRRGIAVKKFPADWKTYGRAAGPLRNRKMAEYASKSAGRGALVAFPGGRGTANMKKHAVDFRLFIFDAKGGVDGQE